MPLVAFLVLTTLFRFLTFWRRGCHLSRFFFYLLSFDNFSLQRKIKSVKKYLPLLFYLISFISNFFSVLISGLRCYHFLKLFSIYVRTNLLIFVVVMLSQHNVSAVVPFGHLQVYIDPGNL